MSSAASSRGQLRHPLPCDLTFHMNENVKTSSVSYVFALSSALKCVRDGKTADRAPFADRRQRAFSCLGGDSASPMHKYLFSCWRKVAQTGDVVTSDTESRGRIPAPQVPVTRPAGRRERGGRESPRRGSPWCLMSSMAGVAADWSVGSERRKRR